MAAEQEYYQKMIGLIMFSIIKIKLIIAFAILVISHFAKNLFYQYNKAVKTIFQYLKAIKETRITYRGK